MKLRISCVFVAFLSLVITMTAQTSGSSAASAQVPPVIQFSNIATSEAGSPLTGTTEITFSLYNNAQGGEPLWAETQNVTLGGSGQYSVYLGITKANGVPTSLFTNGEAHWLGVKIAGQAEQTRVFLATVPYAMKAGDAATVGGLPPSAFVLAAPPSGTAATETAPNAAPTASSSAGVSPETTSDVTTTGGTADTIPMFTTGTNVQNSILTQTSTTAINVLGKLNLPALGTATASAGFNSHPQDFVASVYNSSSKAAVAQRFQLQAEPASNDTASPSGTLNLLYASGTATPAETGLHIASNGLITFASGQTLPTVTGNETVTGDLTATELISTVATGTAPLKVTSTTEVANLNASLLGGKAASAFATLAAANTFTGNQTVNGNLSATGVVTGSSYQIGGNLFAFGSYANANAFLGFAGNTTTTGSYNTAVGQQALFSNNAGLNNTAEGLQALYSNTQGNGNIAVGGYALNSNTTGGPNNAFGFEALAANTEANDNDAFGYRALYSNTTGSPNDAFGYQALYSNIAGLENDAFGYLALYSNNSGGFNTAVGAVALYTNTSGGSNTASGNSALYFNDTGAYNTAVGAVALYENTSGGYNTAVGYQALYSNAEGSELTCIGYDCTNGEDGLKNATAIGAHAVVSQSNSLVLGGTGEHAVKVGIGTTTPSNILTIGRGTGHPVSDSWETYSSRRWKTNIHPLQNALSKVEQLRGVSYNLKDSGKHEIGVIAEEVGAVVPEVVSYERNGKDATGVDYSRLTALLIEAVKQQQREIRDLKSELRVTRQTLQKVKAQVAAAQPALVAAK